MREIELKLLLDPADVMAFRRYALLKEYAVAKPRQQQLVSIYFDTPDLYLWQKKIALRVRKAGKSWVQTLKGDGRADAGLHQRQELESRVDGPNPDLKALIALIERGSNWKKILSASTLADRLVPVFTTRVRRTTWMLCPAPGEEVELVLDQGIVQHEAAQTPICEIELELKSGESSRLFELALKMQSVVPLRVSNISKAERGYAFYAHQSQAAVKAVPLDLSAGVTVETGFQAIVNNCLEQVQGNEMAVEQCDMEGVHQMRVGLRRLRAALELFSAVAPCPAELLAELKWLATELGVARDWDVFFSSTLTSVISDCPEEKALVHLQQAAETMARKDRQMAAASVSSSRYFRLLLSFGNWVHGKRWREALAQPELEFLASRFETFAVKALAYRHRKLLKRGKRLSSGTSQDRHKVRIAAKKVRYAAEFFQALYQTRKLRTYVKALTILQDVLGQLNDAIVADGLLRRIAEMRPEQAQSAGFVEGYLAVRSKREVRKLRKPWGRFAALKIPQIK